MALPLVAIGKLAFWSGETPRTDDAWASGTVAASCAATSVEETSSSEIEGLEKDTQHQVEMVLPRVRRYLSLRGSTVVRAVMIHSQRILKRRLVSTIRSTGGRTSLWRLRIARRLGFND